MDAASDGETGSVSAEVRLMEMPSVNVMAETEGDNSRVVVVGAHLDSVEAGAGINDNGSGVAMILEMAMEFARNEVVPENQVRFVFWGGEELGLLGSMDYVTTMSESDHTQILANLNFDMVASPNPARMIYDGSGSLGGGGSIPDGSAEIEAVFNDWFDAQGLAYQETPFDGRSDYGPFIWTGIPAGGLFTGAESTMSRGEAELYDGVRGEAYDPCYHQACDDIDNIDWEMLDEMAGAAANATVRMGFWEGSLSSGPAGARVVRSGSMQVELPDSLPMGCGAHEAVWRR
jgi:Zn-dependent M28 family amino/carboxypeptidase